MGKRIFKIVANKEPKEALKCLAQTNDEDAPWLMLSISKDAPLGLQIMTLNLFAEMHAKIKSGELELIPLASVENSVKDIAKNLLLPENFTRLYDRDKASSRTSSGDLSNLREAFEAVDKALHAKEHYVKVYDDLYNEYRRYFSSRRSKEPITDTLSKIYDTAFPAEYNKFS